MVWIANIKDISALNDAQLKIDVEYTDNNNLSIKSLIFNREELEGKTLTQVRIYLRDKVLLEGNKIKSMYSIADILKSDIKNYKNISIK